MLRSDEPYGVIFDGDDTLWRTEVLYDEAREKGRAIVARSGLNGDEWEELQRRVDVENVLILGYSPTRFPKSCVDAYSRLCQHHGLVPDPHVSEAVRTAAESVFDRDAELVRGARETVALLRARGARLALLTKGDASVQRKRVRRSGLEHLFHVIRIVSDKAPETVQEIVRQMDLPLEKVWMVGNSVRSDVLPALAAGIRAIWIKAHVWEYERAHDHLLDDHVIVIADISEVPDIIASSADTN